MAEGAESASAPLMKLSEYLCAEAVAHQEAVLHGAVLDALCGERGRIPGQGRIVVVQTPPDHRSWLRRIFLTRESEMPSGLREAWR